MHPNSHQSFDSWVLLATVLTAGVCPTGSVCARGCGQRCVCQLGFPPHTTEALTNLPKLVPQPGKAEKARENKCLGQDSAQEALGGSSPLS